MKKAIVFDLDGTLWDSTNTVLPVWNAAFERAGARRITHAELCSYMGKTMEQIGELVMPELPPEQRRMVMQQCFRGEQPVLRAQGARLYPHLEEVLSSLSVKYLLAIVSNCQDGYIEAFLEHYGFGRYISDYECAKTGKTKGENIALVLHRNEIEKAVYVGDTQTDWDAAAVAGIPFIWARYGFGSIHAQVPGIDALMQLPKAAECLLI